MNERRFIVIKGARQHNLKNVDISIPRGNLVVITGVSGSGKSSLAFDTLYAEGQRRYVESLSAYARQFLDQLEKPDVDSIEGLSPAIAIEQRAGSKNPRSIVATATEIYDYLRLLYARVGHPHCPSCGRPIQPMTIDQMVDSALARYEEGTRLVVLAPVIRSRKGQFRKEFESWRRQGHTSMRVDGTYVDLDDGIPSLNRNTRHDIHIVVDRLKLSRARISRLADSLELALSLAQGMAVVEDADATGASPLLLSSMLGCPVCGISFPELNPRLFSFNSPAGACPVCGGIGTVIDFDPELLVPDPSLTLAQGAIAPMARQRYFVRLMERLGHELGFSVHDPYSNLPDKARKAILHGHGEYLGVIPILKDQYENLHSWRIKRELDKYIEKVPCPACGGRRLRDEALSVTVGGKNLGHVLAMSISDAADFFDTLDLSEHEWHIASRVVRELRSRLSFLRDVGLDYITLDRPTATLSGGEAQRISLATQIGSRLTGVLYILDEPSIGLHQHDNERLIDTLKRLRDLGNTVIVVEHDEDTILASDWVVDMGPGAGSHGGEVIFEGPPQEMFSHPASLTGAYLSGREDIEIPKQRRTSEGRYLELSGCSHNNLKNIDVTIPLGTLVCVTGVSGSGKSSLVMETLYPALARVLGNEKLHPGKFNEIKGIEHIDKVITIDQSPIGRTPRSNPATYIGAFTPIRELFASLPDARMRGYKPGRFSFNVKGGRCEKCEGAGVVKLEMGFLPEVYVTCEVCRGHRYNRETLEVRYKGRNIHDVLEMTVDDALEFFGAIPQIRSKLQLLSKVGMGYVKLGQPATTLSGGEAQRIKLARELSKRATGRTLYILDEPTTGLHFHDIRKLMKVLHELVDRGNTVVVIEHNLEVIKSADWIIDLGPEGGLRGGDIVAWGTPEEVAANNESLTGRYLAVKLNGSLKTDCCKTEKLQ